MSISPQTFIEDFRKLHANSPHCGSWTRASENCPYGDIITVSKDCYMCFNSGNCRDTYYCEDSRALTNSVDCAFCEGLELCYECLDCNNCYNCNFCQDCHNCDDAHFSYDLRRCRHCFGCSGLRDKQYCIFNEQYTAEQYEQMCASFNNADQKTVAEIHNRLEALKRKTPRMFVHQFDSQDCSGDYIYHSKNCYQCFDTRHTEDSGYIIQANLDRGTNDSWDCGPIPTGMDICYDVSYSHYLFNCKHLYWCGNLKDCQFCTNCFESRNLFGCHYLKNKEGAFYILNEKVDADFYAQMTAAIIQELRGRGIFTLYDLLYKKDFQPGTRVVDSARDRACLICQEHFSITDAEAAFYQEKDIMLPVYCPACRADQRIRLRNERKMYKRTCDACKKTLISTYPSDSPYTVFCLDCYWKNMG